MPADENTTGRGTLADPVLIVGVGGSAGALAAYEVLFRNVPDDLPAAFVVVQHLGVTKETLLPDVLGRVTPLAVSRVRSGARLEARTIYVAEPGTGVSIDENGALEVEQLSPGDRFHPIDRFFRSLARLGGRAAAVVVSGAGSDGALGMQAVLEAGGIALAQDPGTARYSDMPRAAAALSGAVRSLPPEEIADALTSRARALAADGQAVLSSEALEAELPRVCELVLQATGHDFSSYKKGTLLRRLEKRIQARQCASPHEYFELLQSDLSEALALQKDLLIGVTRFFRDREAFDALQEQVVPALCRQRDGSTPVRVWVPACSTGEEPYSLAMLFREFAERHAACPSVTIFATDVDPAAVDIARHGVYADSVAQQLSPEQLRRFFVRAPGGTYRVCDELRDMCTFAVHDILRAPPFSRMDLISCRNLFIYFDVAIQKRLTPLLHYALAPEGFLLLGPAEGLSSSSELFRVVDKKNRLYQRREGVSRPALSFSVASVGRGDLRVPGPALPRPTPERELTRVIAAELLDSYAPPALVIDERGEIFFYAGKTARFLETPTGAPTHNAFDVVARSIRPAAVAVVHRAATTGKEAIHPNVTLEAGGATVKLELIARPLAVHLNESRAFLLVFRETGSVPGREAAAGEEAAVLQSTDAVVQQLEAELHDTREHLQSTIEQVKSSNEELLSMNEELQSANEELQTSKEEFQSLNEELETVNAELSRKVDELDRVNSDLQNFFENTRVPTLFLDTQLHIKKFTPAADQLFRLIPSDLGRPFTDIASSLPTAGLEPVFRDVLRTLGSVERELMTVDGTEQHYLMRVNPYRTVTNVISGVVVTFSDVTELKRAQEREATLAAVVESSSDAIVSRDLDGRITSWNAAAEALFWYPATDVLGRPFIELVPPEAREQHQLLDQQVREGRSVSAVESTMSRRDRQPLLISMTVSPIKDRRGGLRGVSVILRDISEKRRIAIERARLAAIVESSADAIISKDLNGIITSWNPGAERLFGYTAEEMVGTPIYRIVPTDHPEDVPRILGAVARGEKVKHYDTVRVAKDGRRIQVWLSVSPIRDESGQVVGASKIARDITERIAAEDALKRGLELRDEFISFASHELKTPLTSMKIQVDRMKRGLARDEASVFSRERVVQIVDQSERQIARLQHLVEDMLDVSRISTRGVALAREEVDLGNLVSETVELLSSLAASSDARIVVDVQRGGPGLVGSWDRGRLEQVVTNLLTNALRYGGSLPVQVKVRSDGDCATLEVQDCGVGIAQRDQERIFERFERVSAEAASGGFGIGLYIVKQIVLAHGGTVKVHSHPGEGATFVVALPVKPPGVR
ncbi:MAG: PAS domain S-box protein [Polyangia bacterium]